MSWVGASDREGNLWAGLGLVVVSMVLAMGVSLVFAPATVSAGSPPGRAQCGTVIEPAASTSDCAAALKVRSRATAGLLGLASWGAIAAVVLNGGVPGRRRRHLAVTAVVVTVLTISGALLRDGVIDRTFGS